MCEQKKQTYKCNSCLAIFVTTEKKFTFDEMRSVACSICEQKGCDYMGEVGLDMALTKDELTCKCDDRCTAAAGPKCSCQCGGKNHQSFQNGYTMITRELGQIKLTCLDEKTITKHKKIYAEFLEALNGARARREKSELHKSLLDGRFISDKAAWWFAVNSSKNFSKALHAKSHASRVKKLNSCFLEYAE